MYAPQGREAKDVLVEQHAPLVKKIAYHMIARLPANVQVDDLIQAGMIGLFEAANNFRLGQGSSFETFASIRIRGAMLDELRRNDWAPKSVHRRSREVAAAIHRVEGELGRDANDQEIAKAMGISLEEYHQILIDTSSSRMVSYDEMRETDDGIFESYAAPDPQPEEELVEDEFREALTDAIGKLPEREQLIFALYYDQELNLKEIGAVLGVTESRVSQLMSQAHNRLRSRLGAHLE
jgi:RNA polymerase sigma factor FliA